MKRGLNWAFPGQFWSFTDELRWNPHCVARKISILTEGNEGGGGFLFKSIHAPLGFLRLFLLACRWHNYGGHAECVEDKGLPKRRSKQEITPEGFRGRAKETKIPTESVW